MRTNIVIADAPMKAALDAPGLKTKRDAVERGLRKAGATVRKTIDTVIATRCIQDRYTLLHDDATSNPSCGPSDCDRCSEGW